MSLSERDRILNLGNKLHRVALQVTRKRPDRPLGPAETEAVRALLRNDRDETHETVEHLAHVVLATLEIVGGVSDRKTVLGE